MKRSIFLLCLLLGLACLLCACKGDSGTAPVTPSGEDAHTHAWSEWSTTHTPSGCVDGTESRLCDCGEAESRTLSAPVDHTYDTDNVCTVCGYGVECTTELSYNKVGEAYVVTGRGASTTPILVIPAYYEGLPVVAIEDSAFAGCNDLTSVTVLSNVTRIGRLAFFDCTSLAEVILCEDVVEMGSYAFWDCLNLKNVTFRGASALTAMGEYAFYGCERLERIRIPAGVGTVGDFSFGDCRNLESVTFGEGSVLKTIGIYAFSRCSSLIEITLPDGVTSIGENAFYVCKALTAIHIPAGVTTLGEWVFGDCAGLQTVTFGEGSALQSIGMYAFFRCAKLTSVEIPVTVTRISKYAFSGCNALQELKCTTTGWWLAENADATAGVGAEMDPIALSQTYTDKFWKRS